MGVKIKGLVGVLFVLALAGFEEDVVFIIAGGVGEVWIDGGIGGVGGRDVGYVMDFVTFYYFLFLRITSTSLREDTLPSVGMCGGVAGILWCVAMCGASYSVRCYCRCGCGGCGREGLW